MKVFSILCVIATLSLFSLAQSDKQTGKPPDIEIVAIVVHQSQRKQLPPNPVPRTDAEAQKQQQVNDRVRPAADGKFIEPSMDRGPVISNNDRPPSPSVSVGSYGVSLTLKNVGTKTIKEIKWDYIVMNPKNQKELARHSLRSKCKIEPGQTTTINKTVRDIGAEQKGVIKEIKYTDGSSWNRK
jgi:hypothetical protein